MTLNPQEWHERYSLQATWTSNLRRHLLPKFKPEHRQRILEVGCGSGAVLSDIISLTSKSQICGLDIDLSVLKLAKIYCSGAAFTCGNALHLPYPSNSFDLCYTHFFLLWVNAPLAALEEMCRVTRHDGYVVAFAEPDYGGRIDYPPSLEEMGRLQRQALLAQGANPDIGRQLAGLFHKAGLKDIHYGILSGQWSKPPAPEERASEWKFLQHDLKGLLSPERLKELHTQETLAWQHGERVLFVPTFYAWGQK
ncbi:MAG: methyltransferase domain-containing protein [Anaerolineae bacterium]|nr:methyltransferase domain-containing protein [Anaerolineae bacterium]